MKEREDLLRRGLLAGAATCWAVAISLNVLIFQQTLVSTRGWGLLTTMFLSSAVTLTVIWAQFRIRRIIVEVFKAGIDVQREIEATRIRHDVKQGDLLNEHDKRLTRHDDRTATHKGTT